MGNPRGKLLGRYEIVAEVGRGAMGSVYKARDPKIDRFVAIKTVLLHQSVIHEQQEFRRRFFIEAQAAGRLLHPGIVAVFDVGEEPETSDPYIVMEYIEGQTLREVLAHNGKKLPLNDALRITQELAEALDYAHAQGVVHRDIKPANVLITKDGQAKISDFGIAQLDLTHMTLPGRVLGTPAYMSPEQLEGEQVDGRSDLFSLGAILYSAVTGYRPFQGNSATTVCFKVANREPLQATSLAPELPHELDAVIARALAKDPTERYQRGKEFAEDLRKLREQAPAPKATTLWFSPPAGGRTWIDGKTIVGKAKREASSGSPAQVAPPQAAPGKIAAAKNIQSPLRAAPRGNSSFGSMLSSW
ncbi:MAG: serine/threonine-protein kinase, partial [Terriglobales bacterium]